MESNSNRPVHPDVEEANENTSLLDYGRISSTSSSQDSEYLWQELDKPWPATFERSISLLSSPVINASEVDHFTKSPKPGHTDIAARHRMVRDPELVPAQLLTI